MNSDREPLSDRLSPVIVKELRQELRMRTFTNMFVWPQCIMMFALGLDLLADNAQQRISDKILWATLVVPLIFFLPRRAFASFRKEEEAKTLELVLLTDLSAMRLVTGKWGALCGQMFLFVCASLPYFVMRYFASGVDILATAQWVFIVTLASMIFIAFGVVQSAGKEPAQRRMPAVVFALFALLFLWPLLWLMSRFFGATSAMRVLSLGDIAALLVLLPCVLAVMFSVGAMKASAVHEDYALHKRVSTLLLVLVSALLLLMGIGEEGLIVTVTCAALLPGLFSAMFEAVHPLIRNGRVPFTLVSALRLQGWPGAIIHLNVVLALFLVLMVYGNLIPWEVVPAAFVLLSGSILFPRALFPLHFPGGGVVIVYLIIQAGILMMYLLSQAAPALEPLANFFPLNNLVRFMTDSGKMDKVSLFGAIPLTIITYVLLYFEYKRELRTIAVRDANASA